MKFEEIHLLAFGPFTDNVLSLGGGSAGLQLIYGPNEAGKSSALRAIDALLYGIPPRTSDNFVHPYPDLRIGARVTNLAGRELSFVRRKRPRKSLVSLTDHEQPLADQALGDFLKGLERGTFQQLYCIGHEEFRAGGQRMRDMQGLLGESLFAASLGGTALAEVLERLDAAAHARWSRRGGSIRTGVAQYQEYRAARGAAEVSGKRWKTLQDELSALETQKAEVVEQQTRWETERRRWERMLTARPQVQAFRRLQVELGDSELHVLPATYSAAERNRCEAALESAVLQLGQLEKKRQSARESLQETAGALTLIPFADTIEQLLQRLGHQWELGEQIETAQRAREQAASQANRLLAELGQAVPLENAHQLRVRREHRAAIQQLATRETHVRENVQSLRLRLTKLKTQLSATARQLEDFPSLPKPDGLLEVQRMTVPSCGEMERLSQQRDDARRSVEGALADLPGDVSLEEIRQIRVPLRATVEQFGERRRAGERQQETWQTRMDRCEDELRQTRLALASLLEAGDVVSEQALQDARDRRDDCWSELRQRLMDAPVSKPWDADDLLPFEHHLRTSDEIADRLRREADRVAIRARESARQHELEVLSGELHESQEEQAESARQWQCEWAACWAEVSLDRLGTPTEMLSWLSQRERVVELLDGYEQHAERCLAAAASRDSAAKRGREVLAELGFEMGESTPWEDLQRRIDLLLEDQEALSRQREQQQREHARVEQEQVALAQELAQAEADFGEWQTQWASAMEWVGLDERVTAAQALARLQCLEELAEAVDLWTRQGELLEQRDQSRQRFESDVQALAKQLDTADDTEAATSVVMHWKEELSAQRQSFDTRKHLERRIRELDRECEELNARRTSLEQQLTRYMEMAGVDTVDALPQVEARSEQVCQMRGLERELQATRGHLDWDTFLAEAEATDEAELEARIAQLTRAIEEEDANRDALVAQITHRKAAMAEIDGNDLAANADQRAMMMLAGVYEDAREFIRLRFAAGLLRQQIERYRDENRDPLLARASQFFSQMTLQQFVGLKADYNDQGASVLVAQRDGETDVPMESLSDGTLDPVYLSLRLAYLERRLQQYEPMPLVVDDILIHLDDERALATLRVLAELATQTQVLFFTHHARLKELAATHLPADAVAIHELVPRWARPPQPA